MLHCASIKAHIFLKKNLLNEFHLIKNAPNLQNYPNYNIDITFVKDLTTALNPPSE